MKLSSRARSVLMNVRGDLGRLLRYARNDTVLSNPERLQYTSLKFKPIYYTILFTMKPFAVIQTGGKQYLVEEGSTIVVNKIEGKEKDPITLDSVLLYSVDENITHVGTPMVPGVKVLATINTQGKGEKIRIARFQAKSRHRRVQGHREALTELSIQKIAVEKK